MVKFVSQLYLRLIYPLIYLISVGIFSFLLRESHFYFLQNPCYLPEVCAVLLFKSLRRVSIATTCLYFQLGFQINYGKKDNSGSSKWLRNLLDKISKSNSSEFSASWPLDYRIEFKVNVISVINIFWYTYLIFFSFKSHNSVQKKIY